MFKRQSRLTENSQKQRVNETKKISIMLPFHKFPTTDNNIMLNTYIL